MSLLDLVAVLAACACVLAAFWCAIATLPLRARVEQLELERPRFIREMEGLVEESREQVDRAEAKRKRADNTLRAAGGLAVVPSEPQPPLKAHTFLERL